MKFKWYKVLVFPLLAIVFSLFSCRNELNNQSIDIARSKASFADSSKPYQEPFRPHFHFFPEKHWMNNPNGIVYYKGIYHLFYQYYSKDIVWGPMHWVLAALIPPFIPYLFKVIGETTTVFGIFCVTMVFTLIWVFTKMLLTKGRTLEELSESLTK